MANQNQFSTLKPSLPGIGNLLKRTWQVYKSRFWTLVGIMAVAWLILGAIIFLLTLTGISAIAAKVPKSEAIGLMIVLAIPVSIFMFWPEISLLYAIKERERKIGIKESLKKGWHKLLPFIWVSALVGLAILGGMILLIIPAILFGVWFSLAEYVLVSEDKAGTEALKRSRELVKGYWWEVFGRFIVIGIILGGISLLLNFIPIIGQFLSQILFLPLYNVFSFLLYEDLKRIKFQSLEDNLIKIKL